MEYLRAAKALDESEEEPQVLVANYMCRSPVVKDSNLKKSEFVILKEAFLTSFLYNGLLMHKIKWKYVFSQQFTKWVMVSQVCREINTVQQHHHHLVRFAKGVLHLVRLDFENDDAHLKSKIKPEQKPVEEEHHLPTNMFWLVLFCRQYSNIGKVRPLEADGNFFDKHISTSSSASSPYNSLKLTSW